MSIPSEPDVADRQRTRLIHGPSACADPVAPLVAPIYQTANFAQPGAETPGPYDYSRTGNPTRGALEAMLADLEGGRCAHAFSSGMAAVATVLRGLEVGARVIAGHDVYGGTYRLLAAMALDGRLHVDHVDTGDAGAVAGALETPAALLLIETPGNPMLRVSDIRLLGRMARQAGTLLAVDNSTMSPWLQRPLELGADLVIESATKFLSGHGDLLAGAVAVSDPELGCRLGWLQNAEGTGLAPFESWLLLRSIKTLAVRLERQQASALQIARWLAAHTAIRCVHYPGLREHPGSGVHAGQAAGPGAVLSLELADPRRAARFVDGCRLFRIAVSFGSVGSLISLPGNMSHAPVPEQVRRRRGLPEGLVRLSVGLEDVDDLIEDLDRALDRALDEFPDGGGRQATAG